jgi:hypothetical protein
MSAAACRVHLLCAACRVLLPLQCGHAPAPSPGFSWARQVAQRGGPGRGAWGDVGVGGGVGCDGVGGEARCEAVNDVGTFMSSSQLAPRVQERPTGARAAAAGESCEARWCEAGAYATYTRRKCISGTVCARHKHTLALSRAGPVSRALCRRVTRPCARSAACRKPSGHSYWLATRHAASRPREWAFGTRPGPFQQACARPQCWVRQARARSP